MYNIMANISVCLGLAVAIIVMVGCGGGHDDSCVNNSKHAVIISAEQSYARSLEEGRRREGKENAVRSLLHSVQLDPTNRLYLAVLGSYLVRVGKYRSAEMYLSEALMHGEMESEIAFAYLYRGRAREHNRNWDGAISDYATYAKYEDITGEIPAIIDINVIGASNELYSNYLNKRMAYCMWQRQAQYIKRGEVILALNDVRALLTIAPQDAALYSYAGDLAWTEGKYEEAEKYYKECLKIGGDQPSAHHGLGRIYIARKEYTNAIGHYSEAICKGSASEDVYGELALALIMEGKYTNALAMLQVASQKSKLKGSTLSLMGIAYAAIESMTNAISCFSLAVEHEPTNATYNHNLAMTLLRYGNKPEGVKKLSEWARIVEPDVGIDEIESNTNYLQYISIAERDTILDVLLERLNDVKKGDDLERKDQGRPTNIK